MRTLTTLLALLPGAALAEDLIDTHFQLSICYVGGVPDDEIGAQADRQVRRISLGREPLGTSEVLGQVAMTVEATLRNGLTELEAVARCKPTLDGLSCWIGNTSTGFDLVADGTGLVLTAWPDGMLFETFSSEMRIGNGEGSPDRTFTLRRCG